MNRQQFFRAVLPAFLLSSSVGQIYAFTNFSSEIAEYTGATQGAVQFAFSLGIFFLGMGAAFFGRLVERNIKLSTIIGTTLFIAGLGVTALGIEAKSVALIYAGYGLLLGLGTGTIYISPVKTMMLWFPDNKAIAAAVPIISFGLGSSISTLLYKSFHPAGSSIALTFVKYAGFYLPFMVCAILLLRKPEGWTEKDGTKGGGDGFAYGALMRDGFFLRSWLFMLLNISAGLCLIPLAKQMMASETVGYSPWFATVIVGLCGLFNGGGRFVFAWWSDRLERRINIMLIILFVSAAMMGLSLFPVCIGIALLVVNACYGAGFSVIPAILSDHYGMENISKIHGAVLSAWGVAGIVGNQSAILVGKYCGGYYAVVAMLLVAYLINAWNVQRLKAL